MYLLKMAAKPEINIQINLNNSAWYIIRKITTQEIIENISVNKNKYSKHDDKHNMFMGFISTKTNFT